MSTRNTFNCGNCGDETDTDDMYIVMDMSDAVCPDCAEECEYCGNYYLDVYDHRYYECDECGRSICPDECYGYCDECDTHTCDDCGRDCRYCQRYRNSAVREYHDNPPLIRYGRGDFTMGVELEFDGDRQSIVDAVHRFDNSEQFVWMCRDGSLSEGAEIISHPMTLDAFRTVFPYRDMLAAVRNSGGTEIHEETGLHIHIDRKAFRRNGTFDRLHAARWIKFVLSNKDGCEVIGRRDSTRWAEFVLPGKRGRQGYSETLFEKANEYRTCDNRYTALNTTKAATYELRFFKSTYRYGDLMAAVEFAHASVEYARTGMAAVPLVDAFAWPTFTAWLAGQAATYPYLAEILVDGCGDNGLGL